MQEAIYNNPKSIEALKDLIRSGFYYGQIKEEYFELTYHNGAKNVSNFCITGTLDKSDNRFYLKSRISPVSIWFFYIVVFAMIFVLIVSLVNRQWLIVTIVLVAAILGSIKIHSFKRMALDLFIDRFNQFYYKLK
ncbi:hypothetical protein [Gilvibacter sp.]|uniref:hypothetical protein n=1 Tax=Gilvibacter sp. TaxID=2729997 RepID=UPI003B51BD17